MTVHTFSKGTPGNFPSGSVFAPNLYDEIIFAGLTNLSKIEVGDPGTSDPDLVTVTFTVALTGTQPTELSGVIDAHIGLPTGSTSLPLSGTTLGFLFQKEELGSYRAIKSELEATTNPTLTDDSGKEYEVGSRWVNTSTGREFVLVDATISGAAWKETTLSGAGAFSHGTLTGLENNDHPQYYHVSGTNPIAADVDLNLFNIDNVGDLQVSGNTSLTGTLNGIRHYGASATDPSTPTPSAGDTYYNTAIEEEMRYDGTRSKWLSVAKTTLQGGRRGGTAAGSFYRATNNLAMTIAKGYSIPKGTIVAASKTRNDTDDSVLEFVHSSSAGVSVVAFLSSSERDVSDLTLNGDFEAGVLSFRNKDGLNRTTDVQIVVTLKRRV